ncbi:MAG: hypothetical protein U0768_11870 [Anaerolineae bacterium]
MADNRASLSRAPTAADGLAADAPPRSLRRERLARLAWAYGLPLLFFLVLGLLVTWPLARDFTTAVPSDGSEADPYQNLWILWHLKEALLGRQPLFDAPGLYYPVGISMLVNATGPAQAALGLPFWPWGAVAAYNGAILLGFTLTGFFTYLLARGVGLTRNVALFAGAFFVMANMHLAGLLGDLQRTFLALIPLALLTWWYALQPKRSPWWAVATAGVMLLLILEHGWQYILTGFAIALLWLTALIWAERGTRRIVASRGLILAAAALVLNGPLLLVITRASRNPLFNLDNRLEALTFQPDAIEFFLPSKFSALLGAAATQWAAAHGVYRNIETAVSITVVGLLLGIVAAAKARRAARPWLIVAVVGFIFAAGPALRLLGHREFTVYRLPLALPYAILTEMPGLSFMRTPGRFVEVASCALSVAAGFGLMWLMGRWPRYSTAILVAAFGLLFLETWPQPWTQFRPPAAPELYQKIAQDPEMYGVFDLPIALNPKDSVIDFSARYMAYQMTHGKGIAMGYLARSYQSHPLFPCLLLSDASTPDVTVNGRPTTCLPNAQDYLAANNYRYVVRHKPQPGPGGFEAGSWADRQAAAFVSAAFPNAPPVYEDEQVAVYQVQPPADTASVPLTMALKTNWYPWEGQARWATSPASLSVVSPTAQPATLRIKTVSLAQPAAPGGTGETGTLIVTAADGAPTSVPVTAGKTVSIPIALVAGPQDISLRLEAGNFQPANYGERDERQLGFAVSSIDLRTP